MWKAVKNAIWDTTDQPPAEPECMSHFKSALRKLQLDQKEEAYQGFMYSIQMNDEYQIEQRAKPLIQLLQSMDKYTEIIEIAEKLFAKNPKALGFLVWKGVALKHLQRVDECEECLCKAVELQPNNVFYVSLYCQLLIEQQSWDKLLKITQQLIETQPQNAVYHTNYIHALEMSNQKEKGQQHIKLVLEKYGATSPSINFIAGDYYYKRELYEKSEECLKKAAELDIKNQQYQIYYIRSLFKCGKQSVADKYCHELINKEPNNVRWINAIGYICFDAFDFESAAKHFKRCIELEPDDPYNVVDYTMVLCEMNELDEAERLIKETIKAYPQFVSGEYRLARILEYKAEYKASQEIYLKIIKINPMKSKMNMGYAHLLYLMGEYQESMKYFEIAKRIDVANPWFHFWFGLLLINDHYKKYNEGVKCFEKCLKLQATHHKCHYEYAYLLYKVLKTDKEKAIEHMKEACRIDYKNQKYQEILKEFIHLKDDDEKEEKKVEDKVDKLVKREYIFKSIDDNNESIVCMDHHFKDIVFRLDALNLDEIKSIKDKIKEGSDSKKDVKIVVVETHTENNKISQKVSHAKM